MDENARSEVSESSSCNETKNNAADPDRDPDMSPPSKKLKAELNSLEERLTSILCCAVCLDLPKSAVFQCQNGHLMCSECFHHLLADAQLRLGSAVCPSCRMMISRDLCVRNLVVEKTVSELPMTCQLCFEKFPRCMQQEHEKKLCVERSVHCCYYRIGCPWYGPFKNKSDHEKRCAQFTKTGVEIKAAIPNEFLSDRSTDLNLLCNYLSCEKIAYNDLILMGPYHTDEYFIRYETFPFGAFDMEWEVRAHINDNEADPTLSSERKLSYQLLLKQSSIHNKSFKVFYTVIKGPFGEMKIRPKIESFRFSDSTPASQFSQLALEDSIECYRLLSGTIKFRLLMFFDGISFEDSHFQ